MHLDNRKGSLAYMSLGSNMGNREHLLREAIVQLHQHLAIDVVGCSSLYETDPVGYTEQPPFINMTIAVNTFLTPQDLLKAMLTVEQNLGRIRHFQNGPRTIDLDLLLYEGVEMQTEQLTLPHPRMHERSFVLIPLIELMETIRVNVSDIISDSMLRCDGKDGVVLWKKVNWPEELGHSVN